MAEIVDRNLKYNLVCPKEGTDYRPPEPDDVFHTMPVPYLKQRHYVCRARASGLFITHVHPMLDGWQEVEKAREGGWWRD